MSFPTIEFAAFFVVVFVVSWALMPHPRAWRPFILVASYVFYGWVDWRWVLLLIASSVVNTFAARVIAQSPSKVTRKRALVAAVAFDLVLLGTFKYFGFFVDETNAFLDALGLGSPLPIVQIVLPIGISFFTFQAISYVVDVYRGETRAASLGDVAILQAFFPHLVAGPIVRANELLPQLRTPRDPREVLAGPALFLIAGGLVKKTVVADELARNVVDPVYNDPAAHSGGEILLAFYALRARRSTATSPATPTWRSGSRSCWATSFRRTSTGPISRCRLQDFWRRWHITLSRWLRDYLYIPLGGNREGPRQDLPQPDAHDAARRALARRVVDVRDLGRHPRRGAVGRALGAGDLKVFRMPAPLAWFVTFNVVCVAWVFFRAPDLDIAFEILGGIGLSGPSPLVTLPMVFLVVAAVAVQLLPQGWWRRAEAWLVARPVAWQGVGFGALLVAADAAVGQQGVAPFIYFQF